MTIRRLTDRTEIQAYLETDRDYAAYALGDLDEGFFEKCTWRVAEEGDAIRALTLEYVGFAPPILFLMGAGDGVAALLAGPVQLDRAFVTAREEHLSALSQFYRWDELEHMWRMVLADLTGFQNLSGLASVWARTMLIACPRCIRSVAAMLSAQRR